MSVGITIDGQLAFPSDYIGAADLKGKDVTLTIAKVQIDDLMLVGGRKQRKPVVYFVERPEKKFVCNKTNALSIAGMYGGEMRAWAGRRITLYPTTTRCKGQTVPCVRIREQAPAPQPHPTDERFQIDRSTSNESLHGDDGPDVSGVDAEPPPVDAPPPPDRTRDVSTWASFEAAMRELAQEQTVAPSVAEKCVNDFKMGATGSAVDLRIARRAFYATAAEGRLDWRTGKELPRT